MAGSVKTILTYAEFSIELIREAIKISMLRDTLMKSSIEYRRLLYTGKQFFTG